MSTKLLVGILIALGCIILLSRARAIAGCYPDNNNPPCEGNLDYDCDVDGSDAFTFKTDFGRSTFGNPCPPDGPAPVPKTGQTQCWEWNSGYTPIDCEGTGQDGEYQKGVAWPNPRFTDNGDGTVTDNLTGLIWLKDANCFGERTWLQALSDCNGFSAGYCGLTDGSVAGDWRLPNRFELESLLDLKYYWPALPLGHPFINVQVSQYWSSTSTGENPNAFAWSITMYQGSVTAQNKSSIYLYYVWPVRGGR